MGDGQRGAQPGRAQHLVWNVGHEHGVGMAVEENGECQRHRQGDGQGGKQRVPLLRPLRETVGDQARSEDGDRTAQARDQRETPADIADGHLVCANNEGRHEVAHAVTGQ